MRQLTAAVIAALRNVEIDARESFPALRQTRLEAPAVFVGINEAKFTPAAGGGYLGLVQTESGLENEVYGKRLTAELGLDVYAPAQPQGSQQSCVELVPDIQAALENSGEFRLESLCCRQARGEGQYLCLPVTAKIEAMYVAIQEDDGQFTDFRLLGRLSQG